ncbi:Integral membrane protein GPR155 [Camelus dromedarius]|uniref:Integral membrane protein GPR155 n=1 Tax=Camelus dromedarius TaxID=9838 RepID=A0A5N4E5C5_CAMDR|nr:Integral membrane protein GPR155 [Camelus dromedarius]
MNSLSDSSAKNLTIAVNVTKTVASTVTHGFNSTNDPPSMSITRLFPALLECFGIVLCGYIAGRANLITSTQAKGLGNFVSRFALPALLFKNMVVLNFSNVDWSFLYSILIAKASVFFIVCVLTLLVARPDSRFSKAGLFPIFATQSNDFALGYPIVEALYQTTYPEYLQYIYLVAPISLMMLNPIGFIFCEIQKWKDTQNASQNKVKIVGLGLLRVLQNPIVFMVFIGIAFNFILDQKVPVYMENFLDGLANSFSGSALFYLGLTMVGKIKKLKKSAFVVLILLITAKLLVLPLLCREMVELLDKGDSGVNHTSLSNYAFLYGVFPVAPGVAIFATQFNMEVEIITSGMVISTFVSAPIMYVSAWLLTFPTMDPKPLEYAIQNVSFDISIISLVSLIWSLAILLLSKKYKQLPHMLTTNLLIAQSIVCAGMMIWNFVKEKNFVGQILVFVLLYSSLYSTYLWTGLLAISLFLLKKRERVQIPVGIIIISGWGIPALLVGVLLITGKHNGESIDSAFFYGKEQGFISFGIFGLDKHLIILPFKRRLEFLWNNKETAENKDSPVPEEIKMTCQQFIHYHRDLCIQNIVKERRCGARTSAGTFCGCDLVNWLIEVGLASDRGEAVIYGDRLVQGGVIQHITNEYEFRDEYLFYRDAAGRKWTLNYDNFVLIDNVS